MRDISSKKSVIRIAQASGKIYLKRETLEKIQSKTLEKGDVFTISRIAAINAVKKTPELIPLCHPIPIYFIKIDFQIEGENNINVTCTVKSDAKTGVEMEALTGVNIALLNIWDVVKMYEKDEKGQFPSTLISDIKVDEKMKLDEKML